MLSATSLMWAVPPVVLSTVSHLDPGPSQEWCIESRCHVNFNIGQSLPFLIIIFEIFVALPFFPSDRDHVLDCLALLPECTQATFCKGAAGGTG